MTKQNKNVKQRKLAADITKMHLAGERGPKKTQPKHGKDPARRLYSKTKRGAKDTKSAAK